MWIDSILFLPWLPWPHHSEWLLRPVRDVRMLHHRHTAIEVFVAPDSTTLVDSLKRAIKHVRFMPVP